VVIVGGVLEELVTTFVDPPFLPRPHFTDTFSSSMSRPLAQASAARSADVLSLKLTKAHLDFATCTTDFSCDEVTLGSELTTCVRMSTSVAEAGSDERNNDMMV